jgi:tRNA threonylcarbamoyladenosine biosynthesis protein TsaE
VSSLQQLIGRDAPRAPDRDSLEAWGRALGAALSRPAVITFSGDLGAGKTTLVRAVCEGLGVTDPSAVTSPTFALIQEYPAPAGTVVHADLYRLKSDAELEGLGWDEIVANASVLLVEWPERAAATLPPGTINVELNHDPDHADRRRLAVRTDDR